MIKMKRKWIVIALCVALIVGWFGLSVARLEQGRRDEGAQILYRSLRRTAITCYALEGFYPPNVAYMQDRYGLQYDETRYHVHYEIFASNLMPDITVVEKEK